MNINTGSKALVLKCECECVCGFLSLCDPVMDLRTVQGVLYFCPKVAG